MLVVKEISNVSSALGMQNVASGQNSFASGLLNSSTGDYSTTLGFSNSANGRFSFAGGEESMATGLRAFAYGQFAKAEGSRSLALGKYVLAYGANSVAIGRYVKSNISDAMILGCGLDIDNYIENDESSTLMIGFNSNLPTFFVDKASGKNTTGKIGIGNVSDPQAKLHIRGDNNPYNTRDASLYIQSSGDYYSTIWLGDTGHYIKTKPNEDLVFRAAGKDFIFNNGNVGIGTEEPGAKLDINGNIRQSSGFHITSNHIKAAGENGLQLTDQSGNGVFVEDGGDVIIGKIGQTTNLDVIGNLVTESLQIPELNPDGSSKNIEDYVLVSRDNTGNAQWRHQSFLDDGDWTMDDDDIFRAEGNVRIGNVVIDPDAKLDVGGKVKMTDFQLDKGDLFQGKILQSDADGNASWVEPPSTDDGDWVIGGGNVYREEGNVGIGANAPTSDLHIKSDVTSDITTTFLKVENDGQGVWGSGSTTIGKRAGSGPVIIQKAGNGPYFTTDEGLRLAFFQRNKNDNNGLSISTYLNHDGSVHYSDIYAEIGSLSLRSNKDLVIRAGGISPINFETNGTNSDEGTPRMQLNQYGQVGIGTTYHADNNFTLLTVAGGIHAQEVRVNLEAGGGADFVFNKNYDLPGIEEVETFIKNNHHLPGIPSAYEMIKNGIEVGEMQIGLLQKIEELTLYVIDLKKENKEMRGEIEELKIK